MISKLQLSTLKRASSLRLFSTATASGASYESFDENIFYSPVRKVSFNNGRANIFNNVAPSPNKLSYVPWEVKEATVKNFLGVIGMNIFDYLFHPYAPIYMAGAAYFGLNWMYRVYGYLGHSIEKIDLLEDGKSIEVLFKTGGNMRIKIKDIVKKENEKELIQTFEEGFMFPIEVGSNRYYIHGSGQEAIKNGEVFRAIING
jgi:hypothetical protein